MLALATEGTGLGVKAEGEAVRKLDFSCSAPNTASQPSMTA